MIQAQGTFPNLEIGDSGLQFGKQVDAAVEWNPSWPKVNVATFSSLVPNTSYTFFAKARNASGIETDASPGTTIMTLAKPPRVAVTQGIQRDWNTNTTFKFQALDSSGPATYDHYVIAWSTKPDYGFDR